MLGHKFPETSQNEQLLPVFPADILVRIKHDRGELGFFLKASGGDASDFTEQHKEIGYTKCCHHQP